MRETFGAIQYSMFQMIERGYPVAASILTITLIRVWRRNTHNYACMSFGWEG